MNGFWVGLLVFPVAVGSLALAVGAVMWAANRWRVWTEESTARLREAQLPEAFDLGPGIATGTLANLQGREVIAELILTSRKARMITFSAQTGVIIVSGGTDFTRAESRIFTNALQTAVQELGLAHSRREQGLDDLKVSADGKEDAPAEGEIETAEPAADEVATESEVKG